MKAPPRLTLPAALTAAILAISTLSPAAAAPDDPAADVTTLHSETDGGLVAKVDNVDGHVVSTLTDQETGELASIEPESFGVHPQDDPRSAGAAMGQFDKSAEDLAERPAPSSLGEFIAEEQMGGTASYSTWRPAGIQGLDVSAYQANINWTAEWNRGARFAYMKATEGNYYKSPSFNAQYAGSYQVGMIRGAYHFAIPAESSGANQADYFINNGGGWSADGRTLPGLLDIEYNPYAGTYYGNTCYNMSATQMVTWIRDFSNRYKARTGRLPMIYSTADWWRTCTGNSKAFSDHPLHLASYGVTAPLWYPDGWSRYDIWQYSDTGPFVIADQTYGGDSNVFGGTAAQLNDLARNRYYKPLGGTAPAGTPAPAPTPKPTPKPVAPGPFTDVPASHVFATQIAWVKNKGILRGWDDGTYRPSALMTRSQTAAALYRLAGSPAFTPPRTSPFADVPTTHVFYKEMAWLHARGISTGWVSDTGVRTFKPAQPVAREQMAAFFYRLAGKPAYTPPATSPFKDVSTRQGFYKEMAWLEAEGISNGWDDGTYRPAASTSRDVMAAFLYRFATRS